MADIDRSLTPLPPPVVPADALVSGVLDTPPLVATTGPSPVLEALVSPALDAADKDGFSLDSTDTWRMPQCWGHRGASASFPENTRMSFVEACKAGADGIETDIHITADNVLVMFHDPELSRTTDGKGRLHDQPWAGVLEHVRTIQKPSQPIPRFTEVLELLMQPENANVQLNIDCKVENDPVKLFGLIKAEMERFSGWETVLAPRLVLGLWHPKFLEPAATILPFMRRFCISMSIPEIRKYFWNHCQGFSVWYRQLDTPDGARFRAECAAAGKEICAWTVNGRDEMLQCARWGIYSIITDKPELWRELKKGIVADRTRALRPTLQSYILPYLTVESWWFERQRKSREETVYLEKEGGRFDDIVVPPSVAVAPGSGILHPIA